jgi:hypothetical protein
VKVQPISDARIRELWCGKCERMTRHTVQSKPFSATCHVCRQTFSRRQRNRYEAGRQKRLFDA